MDTFTSKPLAKVTINAVPSKQQDKPKEKVSSSSEPSAPIEAKITPRITRGANKETKESKEEFYDDFPIDIIKKYNLKISKARREEIYKSRKTRKTNLK